MKGKHHTPEQIVGLLRQAERELGSGESVAQVCRKRRRLGHSDNGCAGHRALAKDVAACWSSSGPGGRERSRPLAGARGPVPFHSGTAVAVVRLTARPP